MNRFGDPKQMTDEALAQALHRAELFSDPAVYADREELVAERVRREGRRNRIILWVAVATLIVSGVGCVAGVLALLR